MEVKLSAILVSGLVVVVTTFVFKILNFVWFRPRKLEHYLRKQGFNGNPYNILLGDMKDFTKVMETEQPKTLNLSDNNIPSHILPYYQNTIDKYGKKSFVWFGASPRINITDAEHMKEILTKPDVFQKPLPEPIGEMIVGAGLLFLEHDKWVPRRKIVNTSFLLEKLKKMVPTMYLSCSEMIGKWEALIGKEGNSLEINLWPYFEDLSGDVISRTAFGSSHAQGKRIFELQKEQVKLVLHMMRISYIPGWRYFPTKANKRMKAINGEIQSLMRGIINQREKAMEKGGVTGDDLLGILMETNANAMKENGNNKNVGLTIQDVIEECKLFYFAGSETNSNLLVWTMVMLAKHQDWQTRARQEVFQVFGKEKPNYEGISQLKTVTMIFYEVLRMYPPVPFIVRCPTKTAKLGDTILPVGAQMTLLIGNLHHDPKIWGDDVNKFNPGRFSQGISGATKTQFSFLPFSAGPRVCIGQNLAMIESKLALIMMLQKFSFELSPSYRHAPFPIVTLQPQYGAPMILHKLI